MTTKSQLEKVRELSEAGWHVDVATPPGPGSIVTMRRSVRGGFERVKVLNDGSVEAMEPLK